MELLMRYDNLMKHLQWLLLLKMAKIHLVSISLPLILDSPWREPTHIMQRRYVYLKASLIDIISRSTAMNPRWCCCCCCFEGREKVTKVAIHTQTLTSLSYLASLSHLSVCRRTSSWPQAQSYWTHSSHVQPRFDSSSLAGVRDFSYVTPEGE